MKQILPICLFLLLVTSCKERPEVSATLDRAEELMESAPDSALTLLQTLDTETFRKRSTHARHALLFTQAQDKNYIDETNDSLISIAVDYYRQHGDVRSRFLSLYYNGRVLTNAGDHLNAMLAYAEAKELVEELRDNYYTGLLYTQLGNLYREFYDFPKSLEAYRMAEKHYQIAGKELHGLYAIMDQSSICRNLNDYAMSDSLLQLVLRKAENSENHTLMNYVMSSLVMQYVEQNRMQEAKSMYHSILAKFGIEDKTSAFLSSVVSICLSDGQYDEAERVLQLSWDKAENADDSVACHLAASEMYRSRNQYDKAFQEQTDGVLMQNQIVTRNLEQPVLTFQHNYLEQELKHETFKREMHRKLNLFILLFLITFIGGIGYFLQKRVRQYYRERFRQRMHCLWEEVIAREEIIHRRLESLNHEMEQKEKLSHQSISNLEEDLRLHEIAFDKYKRKYEKHIAKLEKDKLDYQQRHVQLCQTYFKTLDKIFNVYNYNYYKQELKEDDMLKLFMNLAEKYTKGEKGYNLLENTINEQMDNIMMHLRLEVCLPEEAYYRQACFLFAGFSGNTIASLLNITPNAIYKRKLKIIEEIEKENTTHSAFFLDFLRK